MAVLRGDRGAGPRFMFERPSKRRRCADQGMKIPILRRKSCPLIPVLALALTACNGTSATSPPPTVPNSLTPAEWTDPNSNCAPAVDSTELLANPSFEGNYASLAPRWTYNRLGNPTIRFFKDTTTYHSGNASQKLSVSPAPDASSFVYFLQEYTFKGGITYEASVWLKSGDRAIVTFLLRRAGPYYEAGAFQQITLTPMWTKYTIRGGWNTDVPGLFELDFNSAGTVNVDDASLHEIANETDCVANHNPIPALFFGQHINKWGNYSQWPSLLNFRVLRLWDTGTRWMDIEPSKGDWNWNRLDYYVDSALRNNNAIVYTLGMTPRWASTNSLNTAPPEDINDWRSYVRSVALRYKGKIKYWELWNETDYKGFYTGTVDQMYQLTVAAQQEIKAVDPTNIILAPNITTNGIGWLDKFLALGGGEYVDIISWHRYTTYLPEADLPLLNSVKSVMAQRGVNKPIWNTEGATVGIPANPEQAKGAIARNYIMLWSWGVENYDWYGWDLDLGNPLSQSDWTTPTASGTAYQQTALWLTGSKMMSKHRNSNGTWIITILESNGKQAYIVWNETSVSQFGIPIGWFPRTKRDLNGTSSAISGANSVSIGPSPILLER